MSTGNSNQRHAHHFKDLEHQHETGKQGVWLFLVTEIMMFGGLFVAYAIFHNLYPELFVAGSKFLDWKMGAINTVVLILSSFTMAISIYFVQKNQQQKAVAALAVTVVCGLIFMVIKYLEYSHKIHDGLLPGKFFAYGGETEVWNLGLYFSFYFCMTGLHGIHVLVGMGLIVWVMIKTMRGNFDSEYYTPLEGVGLFWHLVDLIWIYLFPLLYLVG